MTVETVCLAVGVCAFILTFFAIWFTWAMHSATQATANRVAESVTRLETESDALHRLASTLMSDVSRATSSPRTVEKELIALVAKTIDSGSLQQSTDLSPPDEPDPTVQHLNCAIIAYRYIGSYNLTLQGLQRSKTVDDAMQRSFRDFTALSTALKQAGDDTLRRSPHFEDHLEARRLCETTHPVRGSEAEDAIEDET